jgi:hypothetical protein
VQDQTPTDRQSESQLGRVIRRLHLNSRPMALIHVKAVEIRGNRASLTASWLASCSKGDLSALSLYRFNVLHAVSRTEIRCNCPVTGN